jgi:SAM-dependent methyltransferase
MRRFVEKYLDRNDSCRILDVGSQEVPGEVNGSYRQLFSNGENRWKYTGADMVKRRNVNIVLKNPYDWKEIPSRSFDAVVCGQMFEHAEYFWLTILEIRRVLKPNGLCCVIAPSGGAEHRFPMDCYRFYPDGMCATARFAGLEVLETYAHWNRELYPEMDPEWRDCVLIARKKRDAADFGFSLKCGLLRALCNENRLDNALPVSYEALSTTTYTPSTPTWVEIKATIGDLG